VPNSGEEIVEYFDALPKRKPAKDRVAETATHFKVTPAAVHQQLKFWWAGARYLQEFGESANKRIKWDRSSEELVRALNEHGSIFKTAKALGTTSITLTRAIERHHLVHQWVEEAPTTVSGSKSTEARIRRKPQVRNIWPG